MGTINLNTPITVGELLEYLKQREKPQVLARPPRFVYGLAGIAGLFNCSKTTAGRIKRSGKIDKAITQVGRLIIVDAGKALELMQQ